jgi:TPR repeat protein
MIVDMYQRGEGVNQDHAEAARLFRLAVARGDETARHNLRLYAKQYGLPYDGGGADTP